MERERNKITSVCVYCASSTQVASAYREAATELGHLLGERNLRVINGAGNSGLMCAVSDAALAAIVSPIARPIPSTTADVMPEMEYGMITLYIVCHWVAPKAVSYTHLTLPTTERV